MVFIYTYTSLLSDPTPSDPIQPYPTPSTINSCVTNFIIDLARIIHIVSTRSFNLSSIIMPFVYFGAGGIDSRTTTTTILRPM